MKRRLFLSHTGWGSEEGFYLSCIPSECLDYSPLLPMKFLKKITHLDVWWICNLWSLHIPLGHELTQFSLSKAVYKIFLTIWLALPSVTLYEFLYSLSYCPVIFSPSFDWKPLSSSFPCAYSASSSLSLNSHSSLCDLICSLTSSSPSYI